MQKHVSKLMPKCCTSCNEWSLLCHKTCTKEEVVQRVAELDRITDKNLSGIMGEEIRDVWGGFVRKTSKLLADLQEESNEV